MRRQEFKRKIQIRGDYKNPYHLSIGAVLINKKNEVALIRKKDQSLTLPRETMWLHESLEQALTRGLREEVGVESAIIRFLGSLIKHFDRPDGTDVEKTVVYFLARVRRFTHRQLEADELDDEVIWKTSKHALRLLQQKKNPEYNILKRYIAIL